MKTVQWGFISGVIEYSRRLGLPLKDMLPAYCSVLKEPVFASKQLTEFRVVRKNEYILRKYLLCSQFADILKKIKILPTDEKHYYLLKLDNIQYYVKVLSYKKTDKQKILF